MRLVGRHEIRPGMGCDKQGRVKGKDLGQQIERAGDKDGTCVRNDRLGTGQGLLHSTRAILWLGMPATGQTIPKMADFR